MEICRWSHDSHALIPFQFLQSSIPNTKKNMATLLPLSPTPFILFEFSKTNSWSDTLPVLSLNSFYLSPLVRLPRMFGIVFTLTFLKVLLLVRPIFAFNFLACPKAPNLLMLTCNMSSPLQINLLQSISNRLQIPCSCCSLWPWF